MWQDETSCSTDEGIQAIKDLWRYNSTFSGPALEHQNSPSCDNDNQHPLTARAEKIVDGSGGVFEEVYDEEDKCVYEEDILVDEIEKLIRQYHEDSLVLGSDAPPLFLFYSMHLVHMPLQVKNAILEKFNFIDDRWRQLMHAMVSEMDSNVGRIVEVSVIIVYFACMYHILVWCCYTVYLVLM